MSSNAVGRDKSENRLWGVDRRFYGCFCGCGGRRGLKLGRGEAASGSRQLLRAVPMGRRSCVVVSRCVPLFAHINLFLKRKRFASRGGGLSGRQDEEKETRSAGVFVRSEVRLWSGAKFCVCHRKKIGFSFAPLGVRRPRNN